MLAWIILPRIDIGCAAHGGLGLALTTPSKISHQHFTFWD